MEFELIAPWSHPDFQVSIRVALPATIVAVVAVAAAYLAAGSVTTTGFVEFSVFAVVGATPFSAFFLYWIWARQAIAEEAGLRIRGRTSNNSYPWSSIGEIELTTFRDAERLTAMFGRFVGVPQTQPCVRVKLTRLPRFAFFRRRVSTDVTFGTPIPFRYLCLYPPDAQSFIDHCSRYIGAPTSAPPN